MRQLEALIRLSEALARLHLDDYVRPRYVEIAYKLLRTSIVQVHTDDVRLSDDAAENDVDFGSYSRAGPAASMRQERARRQAQEEEDEQALLNFTDHLAGSGTDSAGSSTADPAGSAPGTIDRQAYDRFGTMIALHLRELEDADDSGKGGAQTPQQLVDWLLEQRDDIATVDQLVRERKSMHLVGFAALTVVYSTHPKRCVLRSSTPAHSQTSTQNFSTAREAFGGQGQRANGGRRFRHAVGRGHAARRAQTSRDAPELGARLVVTLFFIVLKVKLFSYSTRVKKEREGESLCVCSLVVFFLILLVVILVQ